MSRRSKHSPGADGLPLLETNEEGFDDFFAGREAFLRLLDEALFLEDFNDYGFDLVLFIFANGTEGELGLGRESRFTHIHGGPHRVLLDKKGILAGAVFPGYEPSSDRAGRDLTPPDLLVLA